MLRLLQRWIHNLKPPPSWILPGALLAGAVLGMVFFLLHISNAFSYLSDNPKTCINCHIMGPEYASWEHSAHREVATCNDCHVPQDNIFAHYGFKALDGLAHTTIFTLRNERQAIIIKDMGKNVVQKNCRRCHENVFVHAPSQISPYRPYTHDENNRRCWECHRYTPHGDLRSLSSAPYGQIPTLKSMIPEWLSNLMKKEQSLQIKEENKK